MDDPRLQDLVELEFETRRQASEAEWGGQINLSDRLYAEADRLRERIKAGEKYAPRF